MTGENGERAWLFGTIHALPGGVEWRTPAFERAFAQADLVMVEIADLGDPDQATKAFNALGRQEGLPALSLRLEGEDRAALVSAMERAGLEDGDFWDRKTWAAALLLSGALRQAEVGNGVDRALIEAGKPVRGMESFRSQFARFDGLDEASQRELLASIAREAQADEARVEAWLTGDLAAIEGNMARGFLRDPALRKALLTERNRLFDGRIGLAMEQGHRPFVAVGAAHMIGADGLPALLARRGYRVRRIQ